jgi:hypothetical protein
MGYFLGENKGIAKLNKVKVEIINEKINFEASRAQ